MAVNLLNTKPTCNMNTSSVNKWDDLWDSIWLNCPAEEPIHFLAYDTRNPIGWYGLQLQETHTNDFPLSSSKKSCSAGTRLLISYSVSMHKDNYLLQWARVSVFRTDNPCWAGNLRQGQWRMPAITHFHTQSHHQPVQTSSHQAKIVHLFSCVLKIHCW